MEKEVLILFKTHLDIGFTDYAENIVSKYMDEYIPAAIKVANVLADTETPFVWTVGSWLIWEALKNDKDGSVEKAIKDGTLAWHALPFTTHTELMSRELFEYGLSLSKQLDERFGKKTIGAKMTDVPGHTIGMVPIMANAGVEFLHIGVNPATPVPKVPPVFKWRYGDSEIIVMYQNDYGEVAEFDDFIVYFAHTHDNHGPQDAGEIINIYEKVRSEYPGCKLTAATLSDVADRLREIPDLPVVDKEIGDTWIHGAATDPQKISRYRRILRHIEKNGINCDPTDNLLVVPEHTWGMDVKTFFHDLKHYTHREMEMLNEKRAVIEKSWEEQRNYVKKAEQLLGITPDYPTDEPDLSGYSEVAIPENIDFEVSWQIFDASDYERYNHDYIRCDYEWAILDITKPGLGNYKGGIYNTRIIEAYSCGNDMLYHLEFDKAVTDEYGLPWFWLKQSCDGLTLTWHGKKASRLPQACWLKMKGFSEGWEISKMGVWTRPEDIIDSKLICATDHGIRNSEVIINPLDSCLVAPFGRNLLQYGLENLKPNMYFNLYNNIWNTNFPMWYDDDAVFRFEIKDIK